MTYPGNTSLSADIRERILGTYQQTLDLASQGNRQEASLGCDFILRLDPEFEPARMLMNRLQSGEGPVGVDDLRPKSPGYASLAEVEREVEELFGEIEGPSDAQADESIPKAPTGTDDLQAELRLLFTDRRLDDLLTLAREQSEAVSADPELAKLVELARVRHEAEPYLRSFLESARQELMAGSYEGARAHLEKARQLDSDHPALADLERLLSTAATSPAQTPPAEASSKLTSDDFGGGLGEEASIPLETPPLPGFEGAFDTTDEELPGFGLDDHGVGEEEDSEGDGRIRDLLKEGQGAFEKADYQGAIDAWSRIFLIDIDHQEAARRIEEARRLKAEHERQVEEIFHEGVTSLEASDRDRARSLFGRVLELQPHHLAAREYLQRLEAGETPEVGSASSVPSGASGFSIPSDLEAKEEGLQHEILVPPEPGTRPRLSARADRRQVTAARRPMPSKPFLLIGGAVLVAVLVGAWLVLSQWDRFFPNAREEAAQQEGTPSTVGGRDPIERATALHEAGKTTLAIRQLQRLPASDPRHEEAQALISQWQAQAAPTEPQQAPAETEGVATEAEQAARRQQLVEQAAAAAAEGTFIQVERLLGEAATIAPLGGAEETLRLQAREALEPLRQQIELMRGGDWEYVLPDLWRLREAEPANRDVQHLLVSAYYNLGVRDLQRGDAVGAVSRFEEALQLAGSDQELDRHLAFARTYAARNKDLLYQIYVKYLPFR